MSKNLKEEGLRQENLILKITLIAVVLIVILIVVYLFGLKTEQRPMNVTNDKIAEHQTPRDFEDFIFSWNNQINSYELSSSYSLKPYDYEYDQEKLTGYIEFYRGTREEKFDKELKELAEKYPASLWFFYQRFLEAAEVNSSNVNWKEIKNSLMLDDYLVKLTSRSNGQIAILHLLSSIDPCSFFKINKYDLWDEGLNKNFQRCNPTIIDPNIYPSLARHIRN